MAGDESHQFAMVTHGTQSCNTADCPFCYLDLPHNVTTEMVVRRCQEITAATQVQMRADAMNYAHQVAALRRILSDLEPTCRLPLARSVVNLFDATFAAEYHTYMRTEGDSTQPPGRGVSASSAAGAGWWNTSAGPTASGSEGTTRRESRFMEEDEYPQWQFRGGKSRKWTAYNRDSNELLEVAFGEIGLGMVTLSIDDWMYQVDLAGLTQLSLETGMIREVRRLTGPPAA